MQLASFLKTPDLFGDRNALPVRIVDCIVAGPENGPLDLGGKRSNGLGHKDRKFNATF